MGLITPLYDDLWNEYVLWSALVGLFTFGWLYHHSFYYTAKEGESPNIDNLQVGVFPKEYDNLKLEFAWFLAPLLLIIYLTFISWAPVDNIWSATSSEDGGFYGDECETGESSNLMFNYDKGLYEAECYEVIGIKGYQWYWEFDCLDLSEDLCAVSTTTIEGKDQPHLSLKAGTAYFAVMDSNDVTHAPWFVSLGIKEDVLPQQTTTQWVLADEVENFLLLCTEYCGDDHAYMIAGVSVHA